MAIVSIELCLTSILAYVIGYAPVTESRSLRRHHHSRLDYLEQVPRNLLQLEDDLQHRHSMDRYERMDRRRYLANDLVDHSLEYENAADPLKEGIPSPHRYRHEYDLRNSESFLRRRNKEATRRYNEEFSNDAFVARKKRHNKNDTKLHYGVNYRKSTEQDTKDMLWSRQQDQELEVQSGENGGLHDTYEIEVKKAQNSSLCKYTVMSIPPDDRGDRVPKDLEHVMCNHAGSSCQDTGSYCCIQTYRNIEVSYGNGDKEPMKLYVGCICALQEFDGLQVVETPLRIHD